MQGHFWPLFLMTQLFMLFYMLASGKDSFIYLDKDLFKTVKISG